MCLAMFLAHPMRHPEGGSTRQPGHRIDYRRLGNSGLKISSIGLGMMSYGDPAVQPWALPEDRAEPLLRRAVEHGVNFFDTSKWSVLLARAA